MPQNHRSVAAQNGRWWLRIVILRVSCDARHVICATARIILLEHKCCATLKVTWISPSIENVLVIQALTNASFVSIRANRVVSENWAHSAHPGRKDLQKLTSLSNAYIPPSLYNSGGQPVKDQEPHFLLCYRKEPHHTHGHIRTSPHLFLTHIPLLR